jgi:hypothetical protein
VREKHDSARLLSGNSKITIQQDARGWYANRTFNHLVAAHITSLAPSLNPGDGPAPSLGKIAADSLVIAEWLARGRD